MNKSNLRGQKKSKGPNPSIGSTQIEMSRDHGAYLYRDAESAKL